MVENEKGFSVADFNEEAEEIDKPEVESEVEPEAEGGLLEKVKAKTGEGDVSDYINHPLNFMGDEGIAQVLRGLSGILGELNYAVVDITIGIFRFAKEHMGVGESEAEDQGASGYNREDSNR